MHRAVPVLQGTAAGLDPCTLGDLCTAQEYLGGAHLSTNRAYQGELIRREESDFVGQVGAIMFGPLLGGKFRWAVTHNPLRRPIPYQKFALLVGGDQPLDNTAEYGLHNERLSFQGSTGSGQFND